MGTGTGGVGAGAGVLKDFYMLDTVGLVWTDLTGQVGGVPPPSARYRHRTAATGSRLFLSGGWGAAGARRRLIRVGGRRLRWGWDCLRGGMHSQRRGAQRSCGRASYKYSIGHLFCQAVHNAWRRNFLHSLRILAASARCCKACLKSVWGISRIEYRRLWQSRMLLPL